MATPPPRYRRVCLVPKRLKLFQVFNELVLLSIGQIRPICVASITVAALACIDEVSKRAILEFCLVFKTSVLKTHGPRIIHVATAPKRQGPLRWGPQKVPE